MNFSGTEYLKLYRKIADWEWYSDAITTKVFIDCLVFANWRSGTWKGNEYKPGQFFTSYASVAERNGLTVQQVRTAFKHLESSGDITRLKVGKSLLVTVVKWCEYQQDNTMLTQKQHDANTELTTDIRSKEDKKIRNIYREAFKPPELDEITAYIREGKYNVNPEVFISYYQANGWKVGKNPMKDWKAAIRQWSSREKKQTKPQGRTYDIDALERQLVGKR